MAFESTFGTFEKNFDAASLEPDEKPLGNTRPLLLANGSAGFGATDDEPEELLFSLGVVQHTQFVSSLLFGTKHVEHVHLSLLAPDCSNGCRLVVVDVFGSVVTDDVETLLFSFGVEQHAHKETSFEFCAKHVEQFHLELFLNSSLKGLTACAVDDVLDCVVTTEGVGGVSMIIGTSLSFSLFSLLILVI